MSQSHVLRPHHTYTYGDAMCMLSKFLINIFSINSIIETQIMKLCLVRESAPQPLDQ